MKPVIEVKNISKSYKIGRKDPYYTLRDSLMGIFKNKIKSSHSKEFWALKDISFKVMPGEILGIIGSNGAGKSTLLKVLSRITPPTKGKAILRGSIASLLEVGTGFNPELTGRENIFLNGSILGMSRKNIKKKFDTIVNFSGVKKFIDTPVKYYSSGMYTRLAFAVAANLDSDILLVDEVLAVGDLEFQKRSLGKMRTMTQNEGRTVLFVSHNLNSIRQLCTKALLLQAGEVIRWDNVQDVLSEYLNLTSNRLSQDGADFRNMVESTYIPKISITGKSLNSKTGLIVNYTAKLEVWAKDNLGSVDVGVGLDDISGNRVFTLFTRFFNRKLKIHKGKNIITCEFTSSALKPGVYNANVAVLRSYEAIFHSNQPLIVEIQETGNYPTRMIPDDSQGNILVPQVWTVD